MEALERFLLLNFVQADGAVFRVFGTRVAVRCLFRHFPVCDDKHVAFPWADARRPCVTYVTLEKGKDVG